MTLSIPYIIKNENVGYISNAISKGMYSYPLTSVIREYIANAIDTHRAVGKENIPIDIYLPSYINPYLIIKDYGEGMSKDFIENSWISFGTSTKRENIEQIGKFGLGSKSFAAISDSLTFSSIFNNVKYTYCVHKDYNNIFNLIPIQEEPVDEVNGTTIYIPCDYSSKCLKEIYNSIVYWTQLLPVKPNIHCPNDLVRPSSSISSLSFKYKKLLSISNTMYNSRLYVVDNFVDNSNFYSPNDKVILSLNGLPYYLSLNNAEKYIGSFEYLFGLSNLNNKNSYTKLSNFVIEVDVNRICLQEPRESINLEHPDTVQYLYNVLHYFNVYLQRYIFRTIDRIKRIDPFYVLGLNDKLNYYCKLSNCFTKKELKRICRNFNFRMYEIKTSYRGNPSLKESSYAYKGNITKEDYLYIFNDINKDTNIPDKYRKVVREYLVSKGIDEFLFYTSPQCTFTLGKNGRLVKNKYKPKGPVIPLSRIVNREKIGGIREVKTSNEVYVDKTQVLGYVYDSTVNNLNYKGLNRYTKSIALSRNIEEEVYYIGISHGSILKDYIKEFNSFYFDEELSLLTTLNRVSDKPIYLIKGKDIPKLGHNFKPINDILKTPDFINARYLKNIYISIEKMYYYASDLEYLSYLISNEQSYDRYKKYRQHVIPSISKSNDITDPFIKRLLRFNQRCNEFLNQVKSNDNLTTKMKLIPEDEVNRIDELLERIENKLKKDYPLLCPSIYYFYDIGYRTIELENISSLLIKYINLIDNKEDNIFIKDDEDIVYNLFK